jgi:HipA-like protein
LSREGKKYFFEYDKTYKKLKNALPLGPELPLWKDKVSSNTLFLSFSDRIPSKNNPAYKDYCREWGISENEKDIFILLTTIGRRGPSTFVFEPTFKNEYAASQLKDFRTRLRLTQCEFEVLFNISHMTLSRLESGKSKGDFYMRYFELFDKVPEALAWMLEKRGQLLHDEKRTHLLKKLQETQR